MIEVLSIVEKRLVEFASNVVVVAAVWLKTLNLDVAHLKSLSPDQLFETYAESIRGLSTRGEQLAATSALMGDESRALISIIDAGPAAFRNAEIEAKSFGLTLSRIDIAKVEAAGDAIDKVQQVFKGVGNKLAVKFSAYIEEIATRFTDAAVSSNGFVDIIESGMKSATMSVAYLGDVIHGLNVVWEIVEVTFKGFAAGLFNTLDALQENIVAVVNLMPGVNIEPIETLSAITREANEEFNKTKDALAALVEQPMPSEKIEAFFAAVEEKSTQAAEKVGAVAGGQSGSSEGGDYNPIEKLQEEIAAKFAVLEEANLAEDERLIMALENRQFIVEDAFQSGLIDDIRRKEILENMELNHQAKLGNIEAKGELFREKFRKQNALAKAKGIFGEMAQITQGVAQSNKTLFEINKTAAIGNAVMNAYEGISNTLSKYPYPLNIAFAALHGIAAFAQVKAIQSTSFEGGGGGTTPSLAGSSGTVNDFPVASQSAENDEQQPAQTETVVIQGVDPDKMFTGQQMRDLAERLNENLSFA